jgi:hypothetical protein
MPSIQRRVTCSTLSSLRGGNSFSHSVVRFRTACSFSREEGILRR